VTRVFVSAVAIIALISVAGALITPDLGDDLTGLTLRRVGHKCAGVMASQSPSSYSSWLQTEAPTGSCINLQTSESNLLQILCTARC